MINNITVEKCYKVVNAVDDNFFSAMSFFSKRNKKHNVWYQQDLWSFPEIPGSKLFAFSSLEDTAKFIADRIYSLEYPNHNKRHDWIIFEAEALNPEKAELICFSERFKQYRDYHKFWNAYPNKIVGGVIRPPQGTIWADSIRLYRRLGELPEKVDWHKELDKEILESIV